MALATILGMPLESSDFTQDIRVLNTSGSSLGISGKTPPPKIRLSFRPHWADPVPPCSLGSTTAKSIAFSRVPFAENNFWVNGIYASDEVLSAIKAGRAVARIAFGGLVHQASSLLVEAVVFVVGGVDLEGRINHDLINYVMTSYLRTQTRRSSRYSRRMRKPYALQEAETRLRLSTQVGRIHYSPIY